MALPLKQLPKKQYIRDYEHAGSLEPDSQHEVRMCGLPANILKIHISLVMHSNAVRPQCSKHNPSRSMTALYELGI